MVNRDLLKEAIADAKAVKETAIANAKAALEEAFTPMMQEKFAKKIAQLDEEDDTVEEGESREERANVDEYEYEEGMKAGEKMQEADDSGIDEIDLEELLRELDEMEMEENINLTDFPDKQGEHGSVAGQNVPDLNEAEEEEEEIKYDDEDADGIEDSEDEEIDIANMDESDLKSFIESVIADMVAAGELEGGESEESEESEEVEINERKKQGYDDREDEKLGMKHGKMGSKDLKTTKARRDDAGFEKRKMEENYMEGNYMEGDDQLTEASDADFIMNLLKVSEPVANAIMVAAGAAGAGLIGKLGQLVGKNAEKSNMAETDEMEEMKGELEEAYQTIKTIQTELKEVNLFNAKLLYTNKIFKAKTLTESQKVKVLAAFDKAASVKEAKLVFETLSEGFKEKKSPVNESLLRGSASRAAGVADRKPILEVNDQYARWQTLAGIKK